MKNNGQNIISNFLEDRSSIFRKIIFFSAWLGLMFFTVQGILNIDELFNRKGEFIASLKAKAGDVQYSPSNVVFWMEAENGQKFFEGDVIATGEEATAKISFASGRQMNIGANSQILISSNKKANNNDNNNINYVVTLLKGHVQAVANREKKKSKKVLSFLGQTKSKKEVLTIKTKNQVFKLQEKLASLSLFKSLDKKNADITGIKGNVVTYNKNNRRAKVLTSKNVVTKPFHLSEFENTLKGFKKKLAIKELPKRQKVDIKPINKNKLKPVLFASAKPLNPKEEHLSKEILSALFPDKIKPEPKPKKIIPKIKASDIIHKDLLAPDPMPEWAYEEKRIKELVPNIENVEQKVFWTKESLSGKGSVGIKIIPKVVFEKPHKWWPILSIKNVYKNNSIIVRGKNDYKQQVLGVSVGSLKNILTKNKALKYPGGTLMVTPGYVEGIDDSYPVRLSDKSYLIKLYSLADIKRYPVELRFNQFKIDELSEQYMFSQKGGVSRSSAKYIIKLKSAKYLRGLFPLIRTNKNFSINRIQKFLVKNGTFIVKNRKIIASIAKGEFSSDNISDLIYLLDADFAFKGRPSDFNLLPKSKEERIKAITALLKGKKEVNIIVNGKVVLISSVIVTKKKKLLNSIIESSTGFFNKGVTLMH